MTATPAQDVRALLDRLEQAHAAASPGPWTAATAPAEGSDETAAEYLTNALRPDEGRPLWVAWAPKVDGLHDSDYVVPVVTGDGPTSEANARYVAEVHASLPALVSALRAVADLADELDAETRQARNEQREAEDRSDEAVANEWLGVADACEDAADRIRSALAAALSPTEVRP